MRKILKNKIVVMGYLCLDIYPELPSSDFAFQKGVLQEVGKCVLSPGGVIGNTGIALRKLGVDVELVAKVGDDKFGKITQEILREVIPESTMHILTEKGETAYCIVLSPSGVDRMFLSHVGVNENLRAADAAGYLDKNVSILHFGYPPLCAAFAVDNGKELCELFAHAQSGNIMTSLDMSLPSPGTFSYSLDWTSYLKAVMPFTDIFMPSLEELELMLAPAKSDKLDNLRTMSEQLFDFGAKVIAVKLGSDGLYVRTNSNCTFNTTSQNKDSAWLNKEFIVPCRQVKVVGTTGAGDSTIAGFLTGILKGYGPEQSALLAVGTGACCVSRHDSCSGIKSLREIEEMLANQWKAAKTSIKSKSIQIIQSGKLYNIPC